MSIENYSCIRCSSKLLQEHDFSLNKNGDRLGTCNGCRVLVKQRKDNNREAIRKQAREHYQTNKETIIEKVKQYRINNPEKLRVVETCACGGKYQKRNKWDHCQTMKHKSYIETI